MSFLGGNPIRSSFSLNSLSSYQPKHSPLSTTPTPTPAPTSAPAPAPASTSASKSVGWLNHIKSYQTEHKVSYKEAMKMAKSTYKK